MGGAEETSRRHLLGGIAAASALSALSPFGRIAAQSTPAAGPGVTRVAPPAWSFAVYQVQSPYTGQMQVPESPPPGNRFVAAEVELANDADQALNFTPVDIRLRDAGGMEYRGGSAIGAEPMISPRNLNPGELSRGWVWFIVPEQAELVELVYVAPGPQFRVPLTE